MTRYIDDHKEEFGVEPICRVLQFAPATYYAATSREPLPREIRDEWLKEEIQRIWKEHRCIYSADKVWAQLKREGIRAARCTVERLMRELGIRGVVRGKVIRTTWPGAAAERPADLVDRSFRAEAPNRLWVADLTYVKTHSGWAYVAFIIDVFWRRNAGWQVSRSLRTDLALDALEMAIWARRGEKLEGLIIHSDQGTQFSSWAFTRRALDSGLLPSMGSVGDCFDNAVMESFWSRMQVELLDRNRWNTRLELANAIFEYLEIFHNRQRRHSSLSMLTPIEFEARHQPTTAA